MKLWRRIPKRWKRVASLVMGVGLSFLGAGNIVGYSAIESAIFGATGSIISFLIAINFVYASKGDVPDTEFDKAINSTIEAVNSKKSADK